MLRIKLSYGSNTRELTCCVIAMSLCAVAGRAWTLDRSDYVRGRLGYEASRREAPWFARAIHAPRGEVSPSREEVSLGHFDERVARTHAQAFDLVHCTNN